MGYGLVTNEAVGGSGDLVAEEFGPKNPCRIGTIANITLSGEQTIDGVLSSTDRILVKDQTDPTENGVYVSAAGAWSRAADFPSGENVSGSRVSISEGTVNCGLTYTCTSVEGSDLVGTDNIVFSYKIKDGSIVEDDLAQAVKDQLGTSPKARVATSANITLSGEQTIDGILTSSDRVLVRAQTNADENGVYVSASGAWARATDFASGSNGGGYSCAIQEGDTLIGFLFICTSAKGSDLIGTDDIEFTDNSSNNLVDNETVENAAPDEATVLTFGPDLAAVGNDASNMSSHTVSEYYDDSYPQAGESYHAGVGASNHITQTFSTPRAIRKVYYWQSDKNNHYANNIDISYSDNGISWTVAKSQAAVSGSGVDGPTNRNEILIPGGLGSHLHWRIDNWELTGRSGGLWSPEVEMHEGATFDASKVIQLRKEYKDKLEACEFQIIVGDETTDLVVADDTLTFRMPYAMNVTEIRANVNTAPVGDDIVIDIEEGGATILSTLITIDDGDKTSVDSATPAVISDADLADNSEISVNIDAIGDTTDGNGLKLWFIGTRS